MDLWRGRLFTSESVGWIGGLEWRTGHVIYLSYSARSNASMQAFGANALDDGVVVSTTIITEKTKIPDHRIGADSYSNGSDSLSDVLVMMRLTI